MLRVGDRVRIKPELNTEEYPWYHSHEMTIIAIRDGNRHFTDYWHSKVKDFDTCYDSITKECLEPIRELKLKKILCL